MKTYINGEQFQMIESNLEVFNKMNSGQLDIFMTLHNYKIKGKVIRHWIHWFNLRKNPKNKGKCKRMLHESNLGWQKLLFLAKKV